MAITSFLSGSQGSANWLDDRIIGGTFHPGSIAKGKNFVGREDLVLHLQKSLRTAGTQVLLYGAFGSGKTSAAFKVVQDVYGEDPLLYAASKSAGDVECELLLDGIFETVAGFPPSEIVSRKNWSLEWFGVKINHEGGSQTFRHSITPTNIARLILRTNKPLIVDNLDCLSDHGFLLVLEVMKQVCDQRANKEFSESSAKVIGIAARRDIDGLIQSDPAIPQRVHAHYVPLLEPGDMASISMTGFRKLNLQYDRNAILRIHYHSCRLPRMLHGICLEAARIAHGTPERNVGNVVQLSLNNVMGYLSLQQSFDHISAKLDTVALSHGLDPDKLLKVAVAAAMRIQDSSNAGEVTAVLKSAGMKVAAVEKYLRALHDVKILELAKRNEGENEFRYAFIHYAQQLALRFRVSDAELGRARTDRDFEIAYDRLYGDSSH